MAREYILGVRVFRLFKEEEWVWDGSKKKKKKIWTSDALFYANSDTKQWLETEMQPKIMCDELVTLLPWK